MPVACTDPPAPSQHTQSRLPAPALKRMSQEQYGIEVKSREVVQANLEPEQYLKDVLLAHSVDMSKIDAVARKSETVFDVRQMRAGQAYTILKNPQRGVDFFIYEKSKSEYVVFDLRDSIRIYEDRMPLTVEQREVSGVIYSSLYESLLAQGYDLSLMDGLEKMFAWSVDFFHLEKGDFYKIIYEAELVDGESIGIHQILAAQFHHEQDDHYAFHFEQDGESSFYDEKGQNLRTVFLRASDQSEARLAEADLIPIYATGDGKILRARSTSQLGPYVQIQHRNPYLSQYTHLNKLAKGLRRGKKVKKGQLIGFDKADIPQMRFSFRKRGRSMDRVSLNQQSHATILAPHQERFQATKGLMLRRLEQISLPSVKSNLVLN